MLRALSVLLLIPFLFVACDSNTTTTTKSDVFTGRWYKRYTGTVAGRQVVLNLYYYRQAGKDGIISAYGNYYYRNKSQIISLSYVDMKDNEVYLAEYLETDRTEDDKPAARWRIKMTDAGAALQGTWTSADGVTTSDVVLKENYDGGYPLEYFVSKDSTFYTVSDGVFALHIEYVYLVPAAAMSRADAQFVEQALLHALGADTMGAASLSEYIKVQNKIEFAEYRQALGEDLKNNGKLEGEHNNWESSRSVYCMYNDKGLLVLELDSYDYGGGAHGNTWSSYVCVDVKERKVWRLRDILNADTAALYAMLEAEARTTFDIKPGDSLGGTLLVDTIPLTENFVISERGITFEYNTYEVASYVEGPVAFFLPYTKLDAMLTPEFKKRMGLN